MTGLSVGETLESPEERGSLSIHDRVVERIALHAASQVDGVVTKASGIASVLHRSLPSADVTVAGSRALVRLQIATQWPRPALQVSEAVAAAVTKELQAVASITVDRIEVTVSDVLAGSTEQKRRVQ